MKLDKLANVVAAVYLAVFAVLVVVALGLLIMGPLTPTTNPFLP